MNDTLVLYHFDTCRYCEKVRNYLKSEGISVPMVDIMASTENFNELYSLAGRTTVPCLVINGTPMWESDDIIAWFRERREQFVTATAG